MSIRARSNASLAIAESGNIDRLSKVLSIGLELAAKGVHSRSLAPTEAKRDRDDAFDDEDDLYAPPKPFAYGIPPPTTTPRQTLEMTFGILFQDIEVSLDEKGRVNPSLPARTKLIELLEKYKEQAVEECEISISHVLNSVSDSLNPVAYLLKSNGEIETAMVIRDIPGVERFMNGIMAIKNQDLGYGMMMDETPYSDGDYRLLKKAKTAASNLSIVFELETMCNPTAVRIEDWNYDQGVVFVNKMANFVMNTYVNPTALFVERKFKVSRSMALNFVRRHAWFTVHAADEDRLFWQFRLGFLQNKRGYEPLRGGHMSRPVDSQLVGPANPGMYTMYMQGKTWGMFG